MSKKLINDPEQVIEEALKRLVAAQPGLQLLPGPRVVYRTDTHALATEDKVRVHAFLIKGTYAWNEVTRSLRIYTLLPHCFQEEGQ